MWMWISTFAARCVTAIWLLLYLHLFNTLLLLLLRFHLLYFLPTPCSIIRFFIISLLRASVDAICVSLFHVCFIWWLFAYVKKWPLNTIYAFHLVEGANENKQNDYCHSITSIPLRAVHMFRGNCHSFMIHSHECGNVDWYWMTKVAIAESWRPSVANRWRITANARIRTIQSSEIRLNAKNVHEKCNSTSFSH